MSSLLDCDDQTNEAISSSNLLLPPDYQERTIPSRGDFSIERISVIVLALLAVLYALYVARTVAFPTIVAFLIAAPVRPLVRWLEKHRIPQFCSAFLIMISAAAISVAAIYFLAEPAGDWFKTAPQKLRRAEYKLRQLREPLEEITEASQQVEAMTSTVEDEETVKVTVERPSLSSLVLDTTTEVAIGAMIAVSLAYMLLVFGDRLLHAIISIFPTYRDKSLVVQTCAELQHAISRYLLTYTAINIGLGTVIGLGLWAMGMPNPILWGVMAAILNYIPFLGLIIGSSIVFLVALLSFDSMSYSLLAPVIYLTANGIEANVITPCLLGRSMRLNTIMILFFIIAWGWMWGIGGAIIAVPILASIKIVCEHVERLRPIAVVLSA